MATRNRSTSGGRSEPGGIQSQITVHPVTPDRWDDMVALFERRGPRGGTPIPGSCWCMGWRDNQPSVPVRKTAMAELVAEGGVPGLVAYIDDQPMGWVSVAPREQYGRLERSRQFGPCEGDENVYAIACFYVDPGARGRGVGSVLLDAAIEHARAQGASAVDAFPNVEVAAHAAAGGRSEENYSYMGRLRSFEERDFERIRQAGKRAVVRLTF